MIQLKLKNKKGQLNVNSKEVKDILGIRSDIDFVQDISNTINQKNIMVFDWKKGCFHMFNIFEKNCFENYPGLEIDFSDLKTQNTIDFLF